MRWFRHLVLGWPAKRHFPPETLDLIQRAIADQERNHLGEVCFAVEGRLSLTELIRCATARHRAAEVFANLRVWDTAHNTGVLIYVLLAEHAIEIVGDRAIAASIDETEWAPACARMQRHFAANDYLAGAIAGVEAITAILRRHFPADGRPNPDELPDRPVIL